MLKYYLICFDISNNRSRRRVANLLLEYGERIQKSVFEVAIKRDKELSLLRSEIQPYMENGDDLRFYFLPPESRKNSQDYQGRPLKEFPASIII